MGLGILLVLKIIIMVMERLEYHRFLKDARHVQWANVRNFLKKFSNSYHLDLVYKLMRIPFPTFEVAFLEPEKSESHLQNVVFNSRKKVRNCYSKNKLKNSK